MPEQLAVQAPIFLLCAENAAYLVRLLHNGGVDDDLFEASCFDNLAPPGRFDGFGRQPFDAFFSYPLTPAGQGRKIDRWLMPKVGFAAEVLPIMILNPRLDQVVIGTGKGVLQVAQAGNQAWRTGRAPGSRWKEFRSACFEDRPVDQFGQFDQGMLGVDRFCQRLLKQVAGRGMFAFGSHQKLITICKKSRRYYLISGKFKPPQTGNYCK